MWLEEMVEGLSGVCMVGRVPWCCCCDACDGGKWFEEWEDAFPTSCASLWGMWGEVELENWRGELESCSCGTCVAWPLELDSLLLLHEGELLCLCTDTWPWEMDFIPVKKEVQKVKVATACAVASSIVPLITYTHTFTDVHSCTHSHTLRHSNH